MLIINWISNDGAKPCWVSVVQLVGIGEVWKLWWVCGKRVLKVQ